MNTDKIDYSKPAHIAQALMERYKDYRRAMSGNDPFAECRAIGAIKMHNRKLRDDYGFDETMIQMLLERAQQELEKEKG